MISLFKKVIKDFLLLLVGRGIIQSCSTSNTQNMNSIDLNQVYSTYASHTQNWIIELTCESLFFVEFETELFNHLLKCWNSRLLADRVVSDLEQKSVVIYQFDNYIKFEQFFNAVKNFNEYLCVLAYSPEKGKIFDSWDQFTFIRF